MKVALQLSGRLRYTDDSLSSMIHCIMSDVNPDVFCSFWCPENQETVDNLVSFLNPKIIENENQDLIRPYLNDMIGSIVHVNLPSMCYKFHRVSTLRKAYEYQNGFKYDVVIQARTDNIFFEKLSDRMFLPTQMQGIWCSNGTYSQEIDPYVSPRMADNFYLGDRTSMDKSSETFWYLRQTAKRLEKSGLLRHIRIPEIIQSKIWNDLGITINRLPGSNPAGDFWYDIDRKETRWK
jgi:hypothetical protein